MYNNFAKGTQAHEAIEFEAKPAVKKLFEGAEEVESAFEALADVIDVLEGERSEFEDEVDRLEKEVEDLQGQLEDLSVDRQETITLLTNLHVASEAITHFCVKHLVDLGALNAEIDSDDSDGTGGDGGSQGSYNTGPGKDASGVTRPQVP